MEFLSVSPESLKRAAEVLRSGGLVAFPTETVYGLGADAYNPAALARIFEAKGRPRFDPLIIHIASSGTLEDAANLSLLNSETRRKLFLLAENLWPGPLSLVLPKSEKIPGIATAGLSTAAFRLPGLVAAVELISLAGGAVAAPSANPFGALSPTRAEHVRDGLGEKADMILDGGPARIGVESTVLDMTSEKIKILRPGGTPKEKIEELIGSVQDGFFTAEDAKNTPKSGFISPGQLKSHYAPRTPLSVFSENDIFNLPWKPGDAFLFFDSPSRNTWFESLSPRPSAKAVIRVLSPSGNTLEAASRLFETLHELDSLKISRIFAQLVPLEGLGEAINDRLRRAAKLG
ncbi:MAG: threonylcarbamoyl-AMP synthase [Treponema sp.]|jgi:L-threonylcarbamoyladenylate synthase|nr:threonylcarbamoyl-AMP synthase [Treponema sp.]